MINHLTGTVLHTDDDSFTLAVHGVGYMVYAGTELLSKAATESSLSVWTHLAVRENALDLYGFLTQEELHLFELVISVSGIGPKSGLAILSLASVDTLQNAIASGEIGYLTKVSGIGAKTAQKIVLELKDKVTAVASAGAGMQEDADVVEALKALGYNPQEARSALKDIPDEIVGTSERVRAALKQLSQ